MPWSVVAPRQAADRLLDGLVGDRAHVTQLLREDQIRRESFKEGLIKPINAASAM